MVCQGCLNNILNQEGHMSYGGCLYEYDEITSSNIEEDPIEDEDEDSTEDEDPISN